MWMHWVSVAPLIFFDAALEQSVASLTSRFGPTVPVAPAAASVWQPLQPEVPANTALPADAAEVELVLELDEDVVLVLGAGLPEAPGIPGWAAFGGGDPTAGAEL